MTEQAKKYIKVSVTLGLIAGLSALMIGLVNMLTADRIVENAKVKEENGLAKVFDNVTTKIVFDYSDESKENPYQNLVKCWEAEKENFKGYIYKASGKNAYGSVSLLVGFDVTKGEAEYGTIKILENTETYGTTLEENYVDPYNKGDKAKSEAIDDVSCGATYGAKLIRTMVNEAYDDVKGRI